MMDDVLEEFASANRGKIKVCRIDEADAALLMEEYGIDRVPSFLAFSGGRVTAPWSRSRPWAGCAAGSGQAGNSPMKSACFWTIHWRMWWDLWKIRGKTVNA